MSIAPCGNCLRRLQLSPSPVSFLILFRRTCHFSRSRARLVVLALWESLYLWEGSGEGSAIAAFVQQGKRIPRRGEVGLDAKEIEGFEDLG